MIQFTKNKIWALAGAIGLSILGSATWEMGVKPLVQWLGRGVLTAVTLGSASVKDGVYREAAKGPHEAAGLALLGIIIAVLFWLPVGLLLWFLRTRRMATETISRSRDAEPPSQEDLKHELKRAEGEIRRMSARIRTLLRIGWLMVLPMFPLCWMAVMNLLTIAQANDAYVFFSQSLRICKPYMTESQAEQLDSHFASVRKRADYIEVTDELRRIASSNRLDLPKYNPW